ncbi:periplasmic binding protein-like I, partial [Catenaria anguillulae PL171]
FNRFFRTIPPDFAQGAVLATFVKNMGWKSCSILAVSDAYGEGITNTFTTTAAELKLNIETIQTFSSSPAAGTDLPTSVGFKSAIEGIQNAGSRIVLFFGQDNDFINVAREAKKLGIIGNPEWVWIGGEAIATLWQEEAQKKFSREDIRLADGTFYPFILERGSDFGKFLARYRTKFPTRQDTPYYGTVTVDCLHALARGIKTMVGRNTERSTLDRDLKGATLRDFLQNFTSPTSGAVNFNADGDRVGSYYIYNIFGGKAITTHVVDPVAKTMVKDPVATPTFFGGSKVIPQDKPELARRHPEFSDIGVLVILAATAALILVILATVGYLFTHRNHTTVRQMSLPMLFMIAIGLCMVLASTSLWIGVPTIMTCNLNKWLFLIGFEFTMGATAAKAYRIWKVFDNSTLRKLNKLSDGYLFLGCSAIILVQVCILLVWTFVAPLQPKYKKTVTSYYYECASNSPDFDRIMTISSLVYNGILLLTVSYLAYKTRKAYSSFRESVFIMYSLQNVFLSGLIISPFLFIVAADFALGAYYIKAITVLYAATFTYVCLIGRIALGLHQTITKSSSTDIKMNLSDGQSSSGGGISTGEAVPGKPQTLHGKYPCKIANKLFETWHTNRLTLFALEGYLGMTRMTNQTEQGKLFKLRSIQFDPAPSAYPLCIEIRADSTSYLVQFNKEADKAAWIRALSVHCLVMSKSSANKSASGNNATGIGLSTMNGLQSRAGAGQPFNGGARSGVANQIQSQYGGYKSTHG